MTMSSWILSKHLSHFFIILVSLFNNISCLLPIFFKDFLGFFNFLFFFRDSRLKFLSLDVISSWWHLLSFNHFLKDLWLFYFLILYGLFPHLQHLRIVINIKWLTISKFLNIFLERVSFKHRSCSITTRLFTLWLFNLISLLF
jgi:hypothetical protein